MHKCSNCGTEFEGKFCPECGAKFNDDKVCPECGITLPGQTKFCPECGHYFIESQKSAEDEVGEACVNVPMQEEATSSVVPAPGPVSTAGYFKVNLKKLFGVMRVLPAILLAVFSSVSFLFFLADVGKISAMGESESIGSVYKVLTDGPEEIKGVVIAMFTVNIIAFLFSVAMLYFNFNVNKRTVKISVAGKAVGICGLFNYAACTMYLVIFIISCVACGQIGNLAAASGEMGAMFGVEASASAAVILTLIFSLLFLITTAACVVGRYLLAKRNPDWKTEEQKKMESAANKSRETADRNAGSSQDSPQELAPVEQMRAIKNIKTLTRHLKTLKFAFFVLIGIVFPPALLLVFVAPFVGLGAKYDDWEPAKLEAQRSTLKKYTVAYGIFTAIMTAFIIVFELVLFPEFALFAIGGLPTTFSWVYGLICGFIWAFAFTFILSFLLCLATYPALNKLEVTFYGIKKPSSVLLTPRYDIKDFYITKAKIEHREIVCSKPGFDFIRAIHLLLLLALVIIVFFAHMSSGRDFIFNSTKYVERINLGDDEYTAWGILGYGVDERDDTSYEYYCEKMRKYMYEFDNLWDEYTADSTSVGRKEELRQEILNLQTKQLNVKYKFIRIDFSRSTKETTSVLLDAGAIYGMEDVKERAVRRVEVFNDGSFLYNSHISAKVWFTDGSYHNSYISPQITNAGTGKYKLSWKDSYFNTQIETTVSY